MKKYWIGSILLASGFSSMGSLLAYKYLLEEKYPVREVLIRQADERLALSVGYPDRHNRRPEGLQITNVESFVEAANIARPAVVHIRSLSAGEESFIEVGGASGSGVIITEGGYILTNNHVIDGASEVRVILNDRRSFRAKVIGTDPSTDLAVIKIREKDLGDIKLQTLDYGNSDEVLVGEWVLAVGNPFNLTSTVTAGIVSAKGRNIDILKGNYSVEAFIQTDAAVNPGNSGGALVDTKGRLVGINTAIITRSGRYEGYSFAVPVNLARKVATDLIEFGSVKRGFLGVLIKDVDDKVAKQYNLPSLKGVLVEKVNSGSAAAEGGLKEGDVITHINQVPVNASPELQEQVALFRPGQKITIEFIRESKTLQVDVTLKDESGGSDLAATAKKRSERFKTQAELQNDLGFRLRDLKEAERKRLKNANGVYVEAITRGSVVERTNMERSFIITRVNGKEVNSVEELEELILKAENEVEFLGFYEKFRGEYSYTFSKKED